MEPLKPQRRIAPESPTLVATAALITATDDVTEIYDRLDHAAEKAPPSRPAAAPAGRHSKTVDNLPGCRLRAEAGHQHSHPSQVH